MRYKAGFSLTGRDVVKTVLKSMITIFTPFIVFEKFKTQPF